MIYQTKHINSGRDSSGQKIWRRLALLCVCLLLAFLLGLGNPILSLVQKAFSPLFGAGAFLNEGVQNLSAKIFADKNALVTDNIKLREEIENLRIGQSDYHSLQNENTELRAALGLRPAPGLQTAFIVAKPPQIPLDSLLLNKGSRDGINVGDWVLAGERTLIGRITEVSERHSTAALSSFPDVITHGHVERTGESLEIKGVGGGSMEVKVPIDFDIALQDLVTVQGLGLYAAASVGVVEEESSLGFKDVLLSLPLNISKVRIVFIEPLTKE